MISVLILTFDEEINLPRCLSALKWADDIVVLDSFSNDGTVDIAENAGARVIQRKFDNFASQRNYGMKSGWLRNDWVLHLDADEVVTPELRDEMFKVVGKGDHDAYKIASKLIFLDKWLKHAGMYPSYQVRLGRKDRLLFEQCGHGQRESDLVTSIGELKEALLHYSFEKGIEDWISKHNRYSTDEAILLLNERHAGGLDLQGFASIKDSTRRRRALKQLSQRLPFRPTLRFVYMYLLRMGFLDGLAGFTYCRMLAFYQFLIDIKAQELEHFSEDSSELRS